MIDLQLDQQDVVISSRIGLARNIADFPFVSTCSDDQRAEIEAFVRDGIQQNDLLSRLSLVDSFELEALERQFLMDLRLATFHSEYRNSPGDTGTVEDSKCDTLSDISLNDLENTPTGETLAELGIVMETEHSLDNTNVTINEEDHLRITVTRSDSNLEAAWDQINSIDDLIERQFDYAFSPKWGYLTACPANVGTGMRVSVTVHLPALVKTGQIDKVFRSLQRINVVARGVFGETAIGDFFRISNQATLGVDEADLIEQVASVIPELVKYEREARGFLLRENRAGLRRELHTALNQLCKFDLEDDSPGSHDVVLQLLSQVRMGIGMGLLAKEDAARVNGLFALVQLRQQLETAIAREEYRHASRLKKQIQQLELNQADQFDEHDLEGELEPGDWNEIDSFPDDDENMDPGDLA